MTVSRQWSYLLCLCMVLVCASTAWGTYEYNVPDDYATINQAIYETRTQGQRTIFVSPGRYEENIIISDDNVGPLTIIAIDGPEETILDANDLGPAIIIRENSLDITLSGFTIQGGDGSSGGGIFCDDGNTLKLHNLIFADNEASSGGGLYIRNGKLTVTNTIFCHNTARTGGAFYLYKTQAILSQCTFDDNLAYSSGAIRLFTSEAFIDHSILWNSGTTQISLRSDSQIYLNYCDIQYGLAAITYDEDCTINWQTGNFNRDPVFLDTTENDYHLKSEGWCWDRTVEDWEFNDESSPCIGAGNPGIRPGSMHCYQLTIETPGYLELFQELGMDNYPMEGEYLTIENDLQNEYGENLRINLGAYGRTHQASMGPLEWTRLCDINNDLVVDTHDFLFIAKGWGWQKDGFSGDITQNGSVGIEDLLLLMEDWFSIYRDGRFNQKPIAVAGEDTVILVDEGVETYDITLDGSGSSDPDGTIASYTWYIKVGDKNEEFIAGMSPTAFIPIGYNQIFLVVTDNDGGKAADTFKIDILPENWIRPDVYITEESIDVNDEDRTDDETISLSCDIEHDPCYAYSGHHTITWTEGETVLAKRFVLDPCDIPETIDVTLPLGIHFITLTVTNEDEYSTTDTITIRVFQLLTADAGEDQLVHDTDYDGIVSVTLDGSGSKATTGVNDPCYAIQDYSWLEGETVLASGESETATVDLEPGEHIITLQVTDGKGQSHSDTVTITVNGVPVADAGGDQTIEDLDRDKVETFTLDASNSSDDEEIISYEWYLDGELISNDVSLLVDLEWGTYTVTLVVTDQYEQTGTDIITLTVQKADNIAPVTDAGEDVTVTDNDGNGYENVALDGSGSYDLDENIKNYVWYMNGEPFIGGQTPKQPFGVGTHTVTLRVTDQEGLYSEDTVIITVLAP